MILRDFKKKNILIFSIIIVILSSSIFFFSFKNNWNDYFEGTKFNHPKLPQLAAQETLTAVWLENPTFEDPIEPTWYSEIEGDEDDINATLSAGQVNFEVLGELMNFNNVSGVPQPEDGWSPYNNSYFITPDYYGINSITGLMANHTYDESVDQSRNRPSIHWRLNVTMPVNMSEYIITSANITAIVNGSADTNVETPSDDLSTGGAGWSATYHDYARFYVKISNLNYEDFYEVASYQTVDLGQGDQTPGGSGTIDYLSDVFMNMIEESTVIFYLTRALEEDNYNFGITLGIDVYTEDNYNVYDLDIFHSLRINSCNLTFSYEKIINQFTSASWKQDADELSDIGVDTIEVIEANLNFEYKINELWPGTSPNSEIRAFINNNKISETIKLNKANSTFQLAKLGGFDITSLIPINSKINFTIEVYIADEFNLGRVISISVDNIYLNITYRITFSDVQTNLQIFFDGNNKTLNPIYEHPVNRDLNITIKYPDNFGLHIPGAIVQLTGNLTGLLSENITLGQYTIIINSNDLNVGDLHFEVIAHRTNYEARIISPILTVTKVSTDSLQLLLNGENKTSNPSMDIAINKLLNITVKYNDIFGTHVPGATVELTGEGIFETLIENSALGQYAIILNTTIKFSLGANLLTITAQGSEFQEQPINPRISVRKINAEIIPVSGSNTIRITPGGDTSIRIFINDTDFNRNITGAIVTYSWDFDNGILTDLDFDGIYEVDLYNIPEGTHTITINAFGSDIYNFEMYEIIIAAVRLEGNALLFQILSIIAIVSAVMIGGYLYAYQKVLKFPKTVRKVRKYRKRLKRKSPPRTSIKGRKKAFSSAYQKELSKASRFLKGKPAVEKTRSKKLSVESTTNTKSKIGNKKTESVTEKTPKTQLFRKKINKNKLKLGIQKSWKSIKIFNKRFGTFYKIVILIILLLTLPFIAQFSNLILRNLSENSDLSKSNDIFDKLRFSGQESFTTQWLNNTTFDAPIQPIWFPLLGGLGDETDVNATTSPDQANFEVIGDERNFSEISGIPQALDWIEFNHSIRPLPLTHEINQFGLNVSHAYDEGNGVAPNSGDQTANLAGVLWKRNITMSVDMSDYIITSASVNAIVNGSADQDIETPNDLPILDGGYASLFDHVFFYIEISDLNNIESYKIASYRTDNLGEGRVGRTYVDYSTRDYLTDTPMVTMSESDVIFYLNQIFEHDPNNFTITLGIEIDSEDNYPGYELDYWYSLLIKSCNLTFTYEKRMDELTSVSWNQNADKISDLSNDTVIVDEAILNFDYKIDQDLSESSPNSELRILINDNLHTETVKLSTANSTFQLGKSEGFDVTSLITNDVNVSIQLYLADSFGLNRTITISIDNVILNISYTIIFPDKETDLHLFLNNENRTVDQDFDLLVNQQLNVTIKYLNQTGYHISNATVLLSGNFTGTLEENQTLGQYSIIIDTDISNIGVNFFIITAKAEDYQLQIITPTITINKISTDNLQVFLNTNNMTLDPNIELVVGEELNITVKYLDIIGSHVPNATVKLIAEGLTKELNESLIFGQYTVIVNTSDRIKIGSNLLTIEAQTLILETQYAFISLYVRKINVDIDTVIGSNSIVTSVGKDITLQIKLNNTDFGGLVKGSIVTYIWEQGSGILADPDNDGIYEITIPNLPLGDFTFTISGFAGDDYDIQDFDIFVISVAQEVEDPTLFIALFILAIFLVSGLISYLVVYQRYLKYPKPVRRVRKFKKSLRKNTVPSTYIRGRETSFKSLYNENIGTILKNLKLKHHTELTKPLTQTETSEKIAARSLEPKIEQEQLTEKVIEKKFEIDDLIKDSSKDPSK